MAHAAQSQRIVGWMRLRSGSLWVTALAVYLASIITAPRATVGDEPPGSATAAAPDLVALEGAFQQVVEQVAPSVVGIRAYRTHITTLAGLGTDSSGAALEQRVLVNGSGTIVTEYGLIMTNEHVIQSAGEITVFLNDGTELPARVWQADPRSDLAVLKVDRDNLTPARFCDWNTVARGQWTVVVGNPFGLGSDGHLSVAVGVVSNLQRQLPGLGEVDDRFYNDMIQTTAPINPGHSGGPLFNIRGEVIGVVTAMHTRAPSDEGIGFAIPMTAAKRRVIEQLCQARPVSYGYLGLTVREPEPEERAALNLGTRQAVIVKDIEPDGPAAKAGLRIGDVLRTLERQPIHGPAHLAELVGQTPVGSAVRLDIMRDGQPLSEYVTIERRDVSRVSWLRDRAVLWRGMRVADLSPEVRQIIGDAPDLHGVLVIDVLPNSPAARANVRIGFVIEAVGGEPIEDTTDFLLRTRTATGALEVLVREFGPRTIQPAGQ